MDTCNICLIDEADVVLTKCKHKLCKCCFKRVATCPYCRSEVTNMNNIMKQLIEDYNGMDNGYSFDESFTESDTFAIFLFHHRFWNDYVEMLDVFVRKVNLTNPELYNPQYATNGTIESGKYIYKSLPRMQKLRGVIFIARR